MSNQPTRQLSLQQPPKRTQVRRQRSADENRSHGTNIYHSDQSVRSRREKNWGFMEKPKVRIAWTSQMEENPKVEVIASRIGTSANKSGRNITCASSSVMSGDKATILYSRQELAERLRLAWKQREANKSNIDIFLAHETTAEERCDSGLSSSSCVDSKALDDERETRNLQFDEIERTEVENCAPEVDEERGKIKSSNSHDKEVKVNLVDARARRAGFQSGMNVAFNGPVQKNSLVSPVIKDVRERANGLVDARAKRTNSAPPLQRRGLLSSPGNPGLSNRPRVNIIIDTPKMGKTRDFSTGLAPFKFERKDSTTQGKSGLSSPHEDSSKNPTIPVIQVASAPEKHRIGNKKRARSGKRRMDDNGRKSELSKSNPDVVTMVSLVSDADSDSEVEKNSPRDDKLVRQLRTNLATTPIIKTCSPLMMSTGNLDNCGSNSLMPRRVLKSVSFQQDSIDGELHLRPRSADRKSLSPDIQSKSTIPQANQLIRSPEEMRTAWQEISCTNIEISSSTLSQNYWDDSPEVTQALTDREKRCLVVPIGDSQDKKRKLLLQRTKSVPVRTDWTAESNSTAQMETKESSGRAEAREQGESVGNGRTGASAQASVPKFIEGDSFRMSSVELEALDGNIEDVEPYLKTTKEKECWHLYRRMCDKGVCVSFDTVLRFSKNGTYVLLILKRRYNAMEDLMPFFNHLQRNVNTNRVQITKTRANLTKRIEGRKHGSKVNVDYKARLEHKLYLARETPEPIFDVSDCGLKNVPSGIYSLCKVFRKKELKLGKNRLSALSGGGMLSDLSLLTVLDLSDNEFTSLPSEIGALTSLEELYLQNNGLRKLPEELTELPNLISLNLSNNKLKSLPETMGNLRTLNVLDISNNRGINKLPKSMALSQRLVHINLDGLTMSYPPDHVLQGGAIAIVAFLAQELGLDCRERDEFLDKEIENRMMEFNDFRNSDAKKNEDVQERRQNALLEVEKNMREQKEYELGLQSVYKDQRKKLLKDLALQQSKLEEHIERVQQEREINRTRLLSVIYDAEKEADNVIKEFLRSSEAERQAQAELLERETKEEMELLSQCHLDQSKCRTSETLIAMEELLEEELLNQRKVEEYTKFRECNAQSLLSLELRSNEHLASVVRDQERDREDLLQRLRKDEVLQKAALAALLERSDARSWSIVQQVNLVQSQLVALTNIEFERKKLEINQQINDIAEKRVILSAILVSLLEQQEKRREQLLETINQIEQQRQTRRDSLFWLMQYQSLMEQRPQGLLEGLEPDLVRHVAIAGALHCLPFLATLPSMLPHVDHEQLNEVGIRNEDDREAVISAAENYLAERKINEEMETYKPSAPLDEPSTSSTNNLNRTISSINTTECVVCMDSQCEVIFLPCGHLCCCATCSSMVTTECPMCRSSIQRKIQVIKP